MTDTGLRYATFGVSTHPAVVLLHGFMGARGDWGEVVESLHATHYCICIDLPGHGESIAYEGSDPYRMKDAGEGVLHVLDALSVKHASIVGYSMGGRLALSLICNAPDRWLRVCLEGSSPGLRTEHERCARRELDEQRARSLERGEFERFLQAWYGHSFFKSLASDVDRFEALLQRRRQNDPLELARSLRMMGVGSQDSYWDCLPDVAVPALFIVGGDDTKFVDMAEEMQSVSPASQLAIVRGAGHNVHYERPVEFTERLIKFLRYHE